MPDQDNLQHIDKTEATSQSACDKCIVFEAQYNDLMQRHEKLKKHDKYLKMRVCLGSVIVVFSAISCWRLIGMLLEENKLLPQQAIVMVFVVIGYCAVIGVIMNILARKED